MRLAWLHKHLLAELKSKKEMHRHWKQGHASWKQYRNAARACRDVIRKAKAQMELNQVRNVKNNMKGFCRYIGQNRRNKENVPFLTSQKI